MSFVIGGIIGGVVVVAAGWVLVVRFVLNAESDQDSE